MCRNEVEVFVIIPFFFTILGGVAYDSRTALLQENHLTEGDQLSLSCFLPHFDRDREGASWLFQGIPWSQLPEHIIRDVVINIQWAGPEYTLWIKNVTKKFTGTFFCVLLTITGDKHKYAFPVIVHGKKDYSSCETSFTTEGFPYLAWKSEEAHLLCGLDCMQDSLVTWRKVDDNIDIKKDKDVSVVHLKRSSLLVISPVRSSHYGIYECTSKNSSFRLRLQASWSAVETKVPDTIMSKSTTPLSTTITVEGSITTGDGAAPTDSITTIYGNTLVEDTTIADLTNTDDSATLVFDNSTIAYNTMIADNSPIQDSTFTGNTTLDVTNLFENTTKVDSATTVVTTTTVHGTIRFHSNTTGQGAEHDSTQKKSERTFWSNIKDVMPLNLFWLGLLLVMFCLVLCNCHPDRYNRQMVNKV